MTEDSLGRTSRVDEYATELFNYLSATTRSRITALVGEWGSGKSWMLDEVVKSFKSKSSGSAHPPIVVSFNPWSYSDQDSLYAGFATFLLQQTLGRFGSKKKIGKLLAVVGPSLKFPVVDLSGTASAISSSLSSDAPSAIRAAVHRGLEKRGQQVVVVMDDIDRLNSDELLMLFKLIRLVGDIPRLHYLLAYDEETIHHLLERTEIAHESPDRARRYLEKIVERRWEVPPLTLGQLEYLVLRRLPLMKDNDQAGDPGLGYQLEGLLQRTVFTPRAADRFVQAVVQIPQSTRRELHQRDFYLAMYLRTFHPRAWSLIVRNRDLLVGHRIAFRRHNDAQDPQAVELERGLRAEISPTWIQDDVIALITAAFPSFDTALSPRNQRSVDMPRIGHSDSFGRYVWLDIPPGDLSDAFVLENLELLPGIGAAFKLYLHFQQAPSLLISTIRRLATASATVDRTNAYRFLESIYKQHEIEGQIDFFFSVDERVSSAALALLDMMQESELQDLASNEEDLLQHRLLLDQLLSLREGELHSETAASWLTHLRPYALAYGGRRLELSSSIALTERATRFDFYRLRAADPQLAQRITERKLGDRSWHALDVATLFLHIGYMSSGASHIDSGIDDIAGALGQDIFENIRATATEHGYPADWSAGGPPREVNLNPDSSAARALAAYYLLNDISIERS